MTSRAPRAPGSRLAGGKYRLVRRLASGGMADVWIARNEATAADVAVKLCASDRPDTRERMRREARLGAMLAHRNIVRVYDLVEEPDGTLALLMELLHGDTFGHYLKARGLLGTDEALAVLLPVLSALHYAHARGVVHRDVTPENIVLAVDPDGFVTPKLVDFGIARVPADGASTLEGHVLGTPRYMAPERIRGGDEAADARGDLFSVGVILCEALTGTSPFAADTPAGSLAAVLERHVDPDPRVDAVLWVEVQRAMAKHLYARHRNAQEMAEALLSARGGTEENLGGILRLPPPVEPRFAPTPNVPGDNASVVSLSGPRLSRHARVGLLGVLLASALVGASLGVVGRERHREGFPAASPPQDSGATRLLVVGASSPAAQTPASSVNQAPTARPSDAAFRPGAPAAPSPPPSGALPSHARPAAPARPRGVATTPGF
jgi:serine/threonine protein kinase